MESVVKFRDFQEQTAADHNAIQANARKSFDDLVKDAVTASRRFAGSGVTKTAQTEVTIAPGRFYDADGAIYARDSSTAQSLTTYLAAAAKRYVAVSVYGAVVDTDVQERDFLIDVSTGAKEPGAVAMASARQAVLAFTPGSESSDPSVPSIPASHSLIALVLVDTIQVVSIAMQTQNLVQSTEGLHTRTVALETFRSASEPRIATLGSDIASLANQIRLAGGRVDLSRIFEDLARVKEILEIPSDAADYGADRFLDDTSSDVDDVATLGYDAMVMEGVRFPDANADLFEADIFAANDPNAALSNGILLPAYDNQLKLSIGPWSSDLGMAQYGFQTFSLVQRTMSRQRLRYGTLFTVCTNNAWWKSGRYDSVTKTFSKDGETFVVENPDATNLAHGFVRLKQFWVDTFSDTYWDTITVDHTITGALIAQSFLITNDVWLTRVLFQVTAKAANENINLVICELTNGAPDLSKTIIKQTIGHADIPTSGWVGVNVVPTFLSAGKRYAIVLISNANHKIAMSSGQNYLDGTFFYSTDGVFYQGDLTKDMVFSLYGAKFRSAQVTIPLESLNLDGGIRNIDILAGAIIPQSTDLIYEVQPNGSGAWRPLRDEDLTAFTGTPPLVNFRAKFVGTRDVMPGLQLGGSQIKLSRPKTAFKHISTVQTLGSASSTIVVKVLLEDFDDTPHDMGCRLRVGASWETADTTVTQLVDAAAKRYYRTFTFNLGSPISSFRIELTGTTNSAANTFHVSERVHWAT